MGEVEVGNAMNYALTSPSSESGKRIIKKYKAESRLQQKQ